MWQDKEGTVYCVCTSTTAVHAPIGLWFKWQLGPITKMNGSVLHKAF